MPQTLTSISWLLRRVDHHGDQAEHGRIGGAVQVGNRFVGPVDGQRVLDQIVGSDRKEIHLLRQVIGHESGGGTSTMMPTGSLSRTECPSALSSAATSSRMARASRSSARVDTRGNRIRRSPSALARKQRPELGPEQLGIAERKPQAPQAQGRVGLAWAGGLVRRKLVRAQVEGPDHDRAAAHRADDRGIDLELLVFARRGLRRSRTGIRCGTGRRRRPAVEAGLDLAAELDIAPELDSRAVQRLGGQAGFAGEDLKPGRSLRGDLAVSLLGFRVGVEDDEALVAVDDGHPAMLGAVQELAQPDHGRDLQGGRDDRGVAGAAAGLGGEARDEPGVDPGRLARASGRAPARSPARPASSWNDSGRSPIKWLKIRASMSRTSAARADRCEPVSRSSRDDKLLEHVENGVLGRGVLVLDELASVGAQGRVGDHPAVRRQDVGVLRSQPRDRASASSWLRPRRARHRGRGRAAPARRDRLGRDRAGRQPKAARVEHHDRADRDPGLTACPCSTCIGMRRVAAIAVGADHRAVVGFGCITRV